MRLFRGAQTKSRRASFEQRRKQNREPAPSPHRYTITHKQIRASILKFCVESCRKILPEKTRKTAQPIQQRNFRTDTLLLQQTGQQSPSTNISIAKKCKFSEFSRRFLSSTANQCIQFKRIPLCCSTRYIVPTLCSPACSRCCSCRWLQLAATQPPKPPPPQQPNCDPRKPPPRLPYTRQTGHPRPILLCPCRIRLCPHPSPMTTLHGRCVLKTKQVSIAGVRSIRTCPNSRSPMIQSDGRSLNRIDGATRQNWSIIIPLTVQLN
jgi:hypothetical protein